MLQDTAPRAEAPGLPATDRRTHARFGCDVDGFYHLLTSTHPTLRPVRALSLCAWGVGLAVDQPAPPGAHLQVCLGRPGGSRARTLFARVVHCTPHGEAEWLCWCELSRELGADELAGLLL